MMVVFYLVQSYINKNAHVALGHMEFQKRYDNLTVQFESVKERLEAILAEISGKQTRKATIESFLAALRVQETLVDRFEPALWCALLDFVTVYSKEDVRFTFKDETEIKA